MGTKRVPRNGSSAARAYEQLRQWVIGFEIRPGERLNEIELARKLKVSRTPLRAALNRLVAEGFLRTVFNRGFFCRSLDVKEIYDLYELRCEAEVAAIRLSCSRVTDEQLAAFEAFVHARGTKHEGMSTSEMVRIDEAFHEALAALCGNAEVVNLIQGINARIRFVRGIDIEMRVPALVDEHAELIAALRARDAARAEKTMRGHIGRRLDQIVDVVKEGIVHIYVGPQLDPGAGDEANALRKSA